jgi:hypothetical protein
MAVTVTRLHPVTLPKPDISDHDRIMAALTQAVADQQEDARLGQSARGVAVVWFREYPDGTFGESWIIQGLNALEAIGLLQITSDDISKCGLNGAPDHFPPGGRPIPHKEGPGEDEPPESIA